MLAINRSQAIQNAALFGTEPPSEENTKHSVQSEETSLGSVEISVDAARLERRLQEVAPANVIRVPRIEIEDLQRARQDPFPDKWTGRILKACAVGSFLLAIPAAVGALMMGPIGALAPVACVAMGVMFYLFQRPPAINNN